MKKLIFTLIVALMVVACENSNLPLDASSGDASSGRPDLVISSITLSSSFIKLGDRVNASITIKNQGTTSYTNGTRTVYISSLDSIISTDDSQADLITTIPLEPGQSVSLDFYIRGVLAAYSYQGVCVLPVPDESNTTNNCATFGLIRVY